MDDNKKSTTIWLRPSVISRMDGWLEADNCQSRSEFVDKALRFYMGYLGTEDNTTYISQAILTAIQGTLDDNNNRLCRILFKCAVELNMLCHTIAAHFRADPIHTRELRAYAVDEVKRTNGQVSFESAVRQQRRIEYELDEEMGGFLKWQASSNWTSGDIRSPSATATGLTVGKSAKRKRFMSRPMFPNAASGSMSPTPPRSWSAASRPATPRMAR